MRSVGGLLFFFGAGSLVLQFFNMEFSILRPLNAYQPMAGILLALAGIGVLALAEVLARQAKEEAPAAEPQPVAAGSGATSYPDAAPAAAPSSPEDRPGGSGG